MEPTASRLHHHGLPGQRCGESQRSASRHHPVLVIHGRSGGAVPEAVSALRQILASPLRPLPAAQRVPLVVLSSPVPLAQQLETVLNQPWCQNQPPWLLPLFAIPGEHVVQDLPRALASLSPRARGAIGRRLPFFGSWPLFHDMLAELVVCLRASGKRPLLLLHPSSQTLNRRFQRMLKQRIGAEVHCPTLAALPGWLPSLGHRDVLVTLQLADNRYDEHIRRLLATRRDGPELLPPLLCWPRVQWLIRHRLERA